MFKVPIISPDLRHEETVTQAAFGLDCLQEIISTIFCQIDRRIEKNNLKVSELLERIKKAQEKINNLQGTRKAIHICAPARYPAVNFFKDIPVTFNFDLLGKYNERRDSSKVYHIQSKLEANLPNSNEKLIFFHVRDNTVKLEDNRVSKELCSIQQNKNLGNMPSDLRSIPSVLLFNTDYSVYLKEEYGCENESYKRAKLFKNKRQEKGHIEQVVTKLILEPAPHSLSCRHNEKLTPSGCLKYTPRLTEAPELNLPLDLPDLPGIADDLRYEVQEVKQKIAPSLTLAVEILPDLTELIKNNGIESDSKAANTDITLPPPPKSLQSETKAIASTPPPPPPPPSQIQYHTNILTPQPTVPCSDSRSELMAAIRNAGGVGKAFLRRTAAAPLSRNRNVGNNKNDNISIKIHNSCAPKGDDLLADLHNKLLMRRKGISGSKDTIENDKKNVTSNNDTNTLSGNPVISRLSALIPPPSTTNKVRSEHTATTSEDEESNDTDWVD